MPLKKVIRVYYRKGQGRTAGDWAMRKARRLGKMRRRGLMAPSPSFTETFALPRDNFTVLAGSGQGKVFKISMSDVPQHPQYMNLYTQYKINWVKVMLVPNFNTQAAEPNTGFLVSGIVGQGRIAYSIQDSPNESAPASEAEVLQDNGAKIKAFGTKWSCSFRPVPDIAVTTIGGTGVIPLKIRKSQWFNYDDTTVANNPDHGAVTAYVTLPGTPGTEGRSISYTCYYKVNFSLRDPK